MVLADIAEDFYITTSPPHSLVVENCSVMNRCYLLTMAVCVQHVNSVMAEEIESSPPGFFWQVFPIHERLCLTRVVMSGQASSRSPGNTSLGLFISLGSHAQLEFRLVAWDQPEEPGAASLVGTMDRTGSLQRGLGRQAQRLGYVEGDENFSFPRMATGYVCCLITNSAPFHALLLPVWSTTC